MPSGRRRERRLEGVPRIHEATLGRLQVAVEEAYVSQSEWPVQVATAIDALMRFAAEDSTAGDLLTKEALSHDSEKFDSYQRLVEYIAGLLSPGRLVQSCSAPLPGLLEEALAGGIVMLIVQRLDRGRASELPGLAHEVIEFALTPYLGGEAAKLLAGDRRSRPVGPLFRYNELRS
jgi:hypothetical protein